MRSSRFAVADWGGELRAVAVRRAREVCFVIPRARALAGEQAALGDGTADWDPDKRALLVRQQL
jgi:hypothetical protein